MSLSSVLKRAGHEVTMFDQANPDTPNEVIIDEMRRQKPDLVGMSFLSTTSYPYAKMLARQLRAADANVKLAFGGVFATLNAQLVKAQCQEVDFVCRGDGEQLIVDLLERLNDPDTVTGVTWQEKDGTLRNNPNRRAAARSRPVAVPGPREPGARFRRVDAARRPGGAVARPLHHDADLARLPVAVRLLRHPDLQRGQVARAERRRTCVAEFEAAPQGRLRIGLLRRRPLPAPAQAHRGDLRRPDRGEEPDQVRARGPRRLGRAAPLPEAREVGLPDGDVRHRERQPEDPRPPQEGADARTRSRSAVSNAKAAGIEIVHGFFVVGIPDETEEDLRATFQFASKIRVDSFGFNRLCVYRGTPLWQEYVKRGLVNDATDWYKYFKCTSIDPTCLPGEEVHRIRPEEMRKLILYKFTRYPLQTFRLLRRFVRFMPLRDVLYLVAKPFLGKKAGATNAEVVSRAVEHADAKSAAADMTSLLGRSARARDRRLEGRARPYRGDSVGEKPVD